MLDMPRPVSLTHRPMSRYKRAAQFAPFAALTGYEELISESGRYVEKAPELSEDTKAELDFRMQNIIHNIKSQPEITITCFIKDIYKDGGHYVSFTGRVRSVDRLHKKIIMTDSSVINAENIIKIESDIFL